MSYSKRIVAFFASIVLILSMVFLCVFADIEEPNTVNGEDWNSNISVMSLNVLDYNTTSNSYDTPLARSRAIISMILEKEPDVIGVQEACQGCADNGYFNWVSALERNLSDIYDCRVLTDENAVSTTITHGLLILYKKDRFELQKSGAAAYSADTDRYYQWIQLSDNQAGSTPVYFYNTHLTVNSGSAAVEKQRNCLAQLRTAMNSTGGFSAPSFVLGDFNGKYSVENALVNFTEGTQLIDAATVAGDSLASNSLDHIFYNSSYTAIDRFERIMSNMFTPALSDHNAIILHAHSVAPAQLTVSATDKTVNSYFHNGTFYINCFTSTKASVDISVSVAGGKLYKDAACETEAGGTITAKSAGENTYREDNTYYLKVGTFVFTVDVRVANASASAGVIYVDNAFGGRANGEAALYCDKWYCRPVTVGTNGFASLQDAINKVENGKTIYLAPGVYAEDVVISDKSVTIYGSNRNNIKALTGGGNKYVLNPGRTYESYLKGSITLLANSMSSVNLKVNGIHFTENASNAQIRILGGNANGVATLEICHNVFDCYTDAAKTNGSAILATNSMQKVASIYDNYFNLSQKPTYANGSGGTATFVNRAISIRNMKDVSIDTNLFNGYTNAIWLSSEVSGGSTTGGYGNVELTNNLFESCGSTNLEINNITSSTQANILVGGNKLVDSAKIYISYADTSAQTNANLSNVKENITTTINNDNKSNVSLLSCSGLKINYID